MSIDLDTARGLFEHWAGRPPGVAVRAPGRVNIIGEHTDYNHGFVLPIAIDRDTVLLACPRADGKLRVRAENFKQEAELELGSWTRNPNAPWMDYLTGVAREVEIMGLPLTGADCLLMGDVPIGAGLSSSASVEMATLCLFESLGGFRLDAPSAASLGQRVENDFLGVSSGIMDQFIVRAGQAGHALFLDCRSQAFELIPIAFEEATFVIADTGVARGLAGSKYNERVAECRQAVEALRGETGHEGTHLRDFSRDQLEQVRHAMPKVVYRRARHVITENTRTLEACNAMRDGDLKRLGRLMNQSDRSLREDYEVTSPELDSMNAIARGLPGCLGSRMTGAGFGGCTVHLVVRASVSTFVESLLAAYGPQAGHGSGAYAVSASNGAAIGVR